MLLQSRLRLARSDVPHHDAPVQRAAAQALAVGRERERVDGVLVSVERLHQFHARRVVEAHTLVRRPDAEQTTVGRHCETHRAARLGTRIRERSYACPRLDVPQAELYDVRRVIVVMRAKVGQWGVMILKREEEVRMKGSIV